MKILKSRKNHVSALLLIVDMILVLVSSGPESLSTTYLANLNNLEDQLVPIFTEYLNILNERVKIINQYVEDYLRQNSTENVNHVEGNPLATFRLIRRFATTITPLLDTLDKNIEHDLMQKMESLGKEFRGYPETEHVRASMIAIFRHQLTYNLKSSDLAEGIVAGFHTGVELTPIQTMELATLALDLDYLTLSLQWLQTTNKALQTTFDYHSTSASSKTGGTLQIMNALKTLVSRHDMDFDTKKENGHMFIYNRTLGGTSNLNHLLVEISSILPPTVADIELSKAFQGEDTVPYRTIAICQGHNFLKKANNLKCWYDYKRHSYFNIQPAKVERVGDGIHLFHSFIGEEMIQKLKNFALPFLQQENVYLAHGRNTVNFVYAQEDNPLANYVEKRIELLLGLDVGKGSSERVRVALYAAGGGMREHHDAYNDVRADHPTEKVTDYAHRLSTVLIYLSDVEAGGLTAFPHMGIGIKPQKGAALYWESYFPNATDLNWDTLHSACPVLLGSKFYLTKWIHKDANMFNRPCPLHPY